MAFHVRVALIAGAASGMGRLAARRLAAAGARVAALDVNEEGLRETARGEAGIQPFVQDVTDSRAVQTLVEKVESDLGPIDRVYNAAAILPTGPVLEQDADLVNRVTQINYFGSVYVTFATLPRMLERGRGDLIQFASVAGWVPTLHFGAYNASKFAVAAFSEVLYHENRGRGVRMVCCCPPPVATPLLEQAISKPRMLETMGEPIAPDRVLDAIEAALEAGRFWVYPGRLTRAGVLLRRFLPGLVWRFVHRVERL